MPLTCSLKGCWHCFEYVHDYLLIPSMANNIQHTTHLEKRCCNVVWPDDELSEENVEVADVLVLALQLEWLQRLWLRQVEGPP